MMRAIRKALAARKARRSAAAMVGGYNYAAGNLLQMWSADPEAYRYTVQRLEVEADCMEEHRTAFDVGIRLALFHWSKVVDRL